MSGTLLVPSALLGKRQREQLSPCLLFQNRCLHNIGLLDSKEYMIDFKDWIFQQLDVRQKPLLGISITSQIYMKRGLCESGPITMQRSLHSTRERHAPGLAPTRTIKADIEMLAILWLLDGLKEEIMLTVGDNDYLYQMVLWCSRKFFVFFY